jgi:hypothetical protein
LCLFIGVPIAAVVGGALYKLNSPLTTSASGAVNWSFGAVALPLALLVAGAVLAWSLFVLPVMLARRSGHILDPQIWPMAGVISLATLLVLAFVAGILFNII